VRIAIVGTGIAANTVAHTLCKEHDVTVFEAQNYVGGHTRTVDIDTDNGPLSIDTGFIVFNDRTYPNFIRMLDQLDVSSKPSNMSFSVRCEDINLEYNGSTLNGLFAQRTNLFKPAFHRMIRDILRFNREATEFALAGDADLSVEEFLTAKGFGAEFAGRYLLPMGSAIWSANVQTMKAMPFTFFARFFHNHGLLSLKDRPQWRVIEGGSKQYVRRLTETFRDDIRLNSAVTRIERSDAAVTVFTSDAPPETFDYVFLGCHSDQALRLLADPSDQEVEVLGSIPYQRNTAVLHTDASVMPRKRNAWAAWNYRSCAAANGRAPVTVSYYMNRLQGLDIDTDYFVTLNDDQQIASDKVVDRTSFEHPVFSASAQRAQERQEEINGPRRSYFCGAWWRYGFHEDGVISALAALSHFNQREQHAQRNLQRAS